MGALDLVVAETAGAGTAGSGRAHARSSPIPGAVPVVEETPVGGTEPPVGAGQTGSAGTGLGWVVAAGASVAGPGL